MMQRDPRHILGLKLTGLVLILVPAINYALILPPFFYHLVQGDLGADFLSTAVVFFGYGHGNPTKGMHGLSNALIWLGPFLIGIGAMIICRARGEKV